MTPKLSIAAIAEETATSPKTIRAYLRRAHTRSVDNKGNRWGDARNGFVLNEKLTNELLDRYSTTDEVEE